MADQQISAKEIEASLDKALEGEDETSLGDMAAALGISAPAQTTPSKQQHSNSARGRGGGKRGGAKRKTSPTPSSSSIKQASDAISALMRKNPAPIPTEDDVALRKIDEMSATSTRLEEELEEERHKREMLEKKIEELSLSHNALATELTKIASRLDQMSKGNAQQKGKGAVTASSVIGESGPQADSAVPDLAPPPQVQQDPALPRGGMARRGRRGGL